MDRITATRALIGAALIGGIAQAWLFRTALGINVVLLTAAVLATGWAIARLAGRADQHDPLDAWLPVAALVVAGMVGLRSDPTVVFLDAVTGATLLAASMAALAGAAVTRRTALAITILGALVLGWICVGILRLTVAARRSAELPGWRSRLPAGAAPIARGLLIALPVLVVFVALFASADAIFATLAGNLFAWQVDLGELPIRVALAFLIAWPVAGLLAVGVGGAGIDRRTAAPIPQSLGAAAAEPLPLLPGLGVIEAVTILVAVDVLFAMFVILQLAYLFGGLDTMAAGGITYANYARGGFFQLVAVTGLAGGLVVCLHAVVEQRTRAFVGSAVGLAILNVIVLASAALRLALYQQAYGWTELRFYIDATIAWLGIGIVAATVLLVRNRMCWLPHAMTIAAVVVLIAVNVIGPLRLVADENVARLLDPSRVPPDGRRGLDLDYMLTLDDDAVPALVAALPAVAGDDRAAVLSWLEDRRVELGRPETTAWPAWNLARQEARRALEALVRR
jgi:Domain of unknown function (DUF4173)